MSSPPRSARAAHSISCCAGGRRPTRTAGRCFTGSRGPGFAAVGPVSKIEAVEEGALIVQRLSEDGFQRVRVELPALLAISSEINEPRMPSLKGTMAAGRAHISGWKAADLLAAASSRRSSCGGSSSR